MKDNSYLTEVVANCDQFNSVKIQDRILFFRDKPILTDYDLADLYNVETKRLNEQVKRNIERFPERFRFQLTEVEKNELVANCDRFNKLRFSHSLPYAFTEQGVAMLSTVLRSETAVQVSISIMDAFVAMRHHISFHSGLFNRIETLESNQLDLIQHQSITDKRIEEVLQLMERNNETPKQGIFYDGQIYEAYCFVSNLIRAAKECIILIDNYIDDTVLTMLDKRAENVSAIIYTSHLGKSLQVDITKHNAQFPPIEVKHCSSVHDRFLITDEKVYHIGASIKDLGKKLFGFSLMLDIKPSELLQKLDKV